MNFLGVSMIQTPDIAELEKMRYAGESNDALSKKAIMIIDRMVRELDTARKILDIPTCERIVAECEELKSVVKSICSGRGEHALDEFAKHIEELGRASGMP